MQEFPIRIDAKAQTHFCLEAREELLKCHWSPQERDGWVCGVGKGGEVGKLSTV